MSDSKDSLGDRMKSYENVSRYYLARKLPVIIRVDGKAFHSFTHGFKRPFDDILIKTMQDTAKYLCENIMGCKIAYTQSDEISLLLTDYERIESQAWFDNNLQKLVSVAASMATLAFNKAFKHNVSDYINSLEIEPDFKYLYALSIAENNGASFDARAFILPQDEVCNYFIWRQQDATRNSIQMVAQANFSHNELQGKNCDMLQDMLHEQKGINWNDFNIVYKRGSCVVKETYAVTECLSPVTRTRWIADKNIPIFTQDRNYIERYVFPERTESLN